MRMGIEGCDWEAMKEIKAMVPVASKEETVDALLTAKEDQEARVWLWTYDGIGTGRSSDYDEWEPSGLMSPEAQDWEAHRWHRAEATECPPCE